MKTISKLTIAMGVLLTTLSCDGIVGISRGASLRVYTPGGQTQVGWGEPSEPLILVNGRDDPQGLAGLRVEVDDRVFTAEDLPSDRFGVPESGTIHVDVRLMQDGVIVAEGRVSWALESDIEWEIELDRAPYPINAGVSDENLHEPSPPCAWFWCHRVWRFEISEDARNYDGEALWMSLWRVEPGKCVDIC